MQDQNNSIPQSHLPHLRQGGFAPLDVAHVFDLEFPVAGEEVGRGNEFVVNRLLENPDQVVKTALPDRPAEWAAARIARKAVLQKLMLETFTPQEISIVPVTISEGYMLQRYVLGETLGALANAADPSVKQQAFDLWIAARNLLNGEFWFLAHETMKREWQEGALQPFTRQDLKPFWIDIDMVNFILPASSLARVENLRSLQPVLVDW